MPANQLRIIGGAHRGRRIRFSESEGLRPTSNRLRETLFNWLQWDIEGADCLDVFAGSGALGFEALSRGAATVVMLEKSRPVMLQLMDNKSQLHADNVTVELCDGMQYLRACTKQFDVIFLDPPFDKMLLSDALKKIKDNQLLKDEGMVYVEMPKQADIDFSDWEVVKETLVSSVKAYLLRCQA